MLENQLPAIMAQKRVSIRELSRQTGITYTTVRAIYHGERRSIQLKVLEAICRALQVQPGDIYRIRTGGESGAERGTKSKAEDSTPNTPETPTPAASDQPAKKPVQVEGWRSW